MGVSHSAPRQSLLARLAARSRPWVRTFALTWFWVVVAMTPLVSTRAEAPAGPQWSKLSVGPATVHAEKGTEALASRLAASAPPMIGAIAALLQIDPPEELDIVVAANAASFAAGQRGSPPSWAAGTAWPEDGEIWLRADLRGGTAIEQVFAHELVHVVLGQAAGPEAPAWFQEGLARMLAGEITLQTRAALLRAALFDRVLPFSRLEHSWPRGAVEAQLAYAQSADFVAWIHETNPGAIRRLAANFAVGQGVDLAFRGAVGATFAGAEQRWRSRITFWHAFFPAIGDGALLWGAAAAIFLVGGTARIIRTRRKVRAMRTFELPPEPAEARLPGW